MTFSINMLDDIASKLSIISLVIIGAKFISKRSGVAELDMIFKKMHKPAAYVLLIAGFTHTFTSFIYYDVFGVWPYVFGIIGIISGTAAIISFKFKPKYEEQWLFWHRTFTGIAIVSIVIHLVLQSGV